MTATPPTQPLSATTRLLAAVIENYQTRDREVVVPAVLRPYLGGRDIL